MLGHSYGTIVIGYAARESIDADRIVIVASPGMGVQNAADLHLEGYSSSDGRSGRRAADDPMWWANVIEGHGPDPIAGRFGARVFESADSGRAPPHSGYWEPESASLESIGRLIVGAADCSVSGGADCLVSWT